MPFLTQRNFHVLLVNPAFKLGFITDVQVMGRLGEQGPAFSFKNDTVTATQIFGQSFVRHAGISESAIVEHDESLRGLDRSDLNQIDESGIPHGTGLHLLKQFVDLFHLIVEERLPIGARMAFEQGMHCRRAIGIRVDDQSAQEHRAVFDRE